MAKFIVIYNEPKDKEGFEKHYQGVHMPLANELPNVKTVSVDRVVNAMNTEEKVYLHVELEFESIEVLNNSLASEVGKKVQKDTKNLLPFLNEPPKVLITE